MNKSMLSIIIAAALLVGAILSAVLFAGCCKAPAGISALEGVLDGCNKKSEKAIVSNFVTGEYSASFSSCVTPDDYLKKCGISFDYMYDDANVTEKFYLVGTASNQEMDEVNSLMSSLSTEYEMLEAYIAADYTNADGNSQTAMTTVTFTVKDGKIFYIS